MPRAKIVKAPQLPAAEQIDETQNAALLLLKELLQQIGS